MLEDTTNMVLIYGGNVKSLEEQVNEYRDRINQRYREILGDRYYQRLQRESERLLVPECFFDSIDELNRISQENLPRETPSKLLFLSDANLKPDDNGRIKKRNVNGSYGFYINDESFTHSGSSQITDKIIASYIHEYNHFVYGVLQRVPLYLARTTMISELSGKPVLLEDLPGIVDSIQYSPMPYQDKKNKIFLALNAYSMNDIWEKSTRILDKLILERIGINVAIPWRGKERKYGGKHLDEINMIIAIPLEGDPHKGLYDREVIRRIIEWEKYLNPVMRNEFVDNFYNSLKELSVRLMPLPELIEKNKREWEKHRKSKVYKREQELKKQLKKRRKK